MNCVWLLDEVQLQQCTRNQAFLRYSVGDTVLGGVCSTRDRVKTANLLMLISLERKEVQPSSLDCDYLKVSTYIVPRIIAFSLLTAQN